MLYEGIFYSLIPCLIKMNQMETDTRKYEQHRYENNYNKRPRGLDGLLGLLLVKRIPAMHKLSSTKIPEYLSQGLVLKTGNAPNDPKLTLNT